MEFQIEQVEGVTVVKVTGEIDGRTSPALERAIMPLLGDECALVLDLGKTTHMSSAGLRILLLVHREARSRRARFALSGVCREIQSVMGSTGFLRFFTVAETTRSAVNLVARAPSPAAT